MFTRRFSYPYNDGRQFCIFSCSLTEPFTLCQILIGIPLPHRLSAYDKVKSFGHTIVMKRQMYRSNFTTHIESERRHKSSQEYISLLLFYFFTASAAGFLWEVLLLFIKEGHFRNRGFLYGPWLPVYGTGAILLYVLLSGLKRRPVKAFLYSLILGTSLELIIGLVLDCFWGLRYWDYTGSPLNFRGYICLLSALGIGIAGALWICLLSALLEKLWFHIPEKIRSAVSLILILLFTADCAAALIFPNTGRGITFS